MRKVIVSLTVVALVAMAAVGPQAAGAKKKKKPPPPREAVITYEAPSIGSGDATGTCSPAVNGCVNFPVGAEETFVSIKITDDSGLAPAATIGQDQNPNDNFVDRVAEICGETEQPLAIVPGAEIVVWVWAAPRFVQGGPCPGIGTSGEVTATFSSTP